MTIALLLAFFLGSPVQAQPPSPGLDGAVVDEYGHPVPETEIRMESQDEAKTVHRTRADAGGRFRLTLAPGTYELLATRSGFAPALEGVAVRGFKKRDEVRLTLRRGRSLTGLVTDEQGRPVDGAEVELTRTRGGQGLYGLPEEGAGFYRACTGPDGRFEVRGLPTDWFAIRIEHPDFAPLIKTGLGVPDGLGPQETGTLVLQAGRRLEGIVVDPQGQPLPQTKLWLREPRAPREMEDLFPQRRPLQVTGTDGRFFIPHLQERKGQTLYACRKGLVAYELKLGEIPAEPLRIVLGVSPRLSGRVMDEAGAPIPGALIEARLTSIHPSGVVLDIDHPCPETGASPNARTDREGRFILEPMLPGTFDLQASADGFATGLLRKGAEIRQGEAAEDLEIVL
ncbi:MAG TPA: carboxypeptidase-like regulatory domain-containing protein, partial [Thermoanaerobaculia bacterium]